MLLVFGECSKKRTAPAQAHERFAPSEAIPGKHQLECCTVGDSKHSKRCMCCMLQESCALTTCARFRNISSKTVVLVPPSFAYIMSWVFSALSKLTLRTRTSLVLAGLLLLAWLRKQAAQARRKALSTICEGCERSSSRISALQLLLPEVLGELQGPRCSG